MVERAIERPYQEDTAMTQTNQKTTKTEKPCCCGQTNAQQGCNCGPTCQCASPCTCANACACKPEQA